MWGIFFFLLFLSLPLMTETSRRPLGAKLDGSRRQKVCRGRPSVWRFELCCPKRSSNPKLLMPQWSCMTPVFCPVTAGIWDSQRAVVGVFVPGPSNHSGAVHPTWWAHLQRAQERQRGGSGDGKEPGCKEMLWILWCILRKCFTFTNNKCETIYYLVREEKCKMVIVKSCLFK